MSELKVYTVTHLHERKKWTTDIISSSRYKASTYVEGEVLNVSKGSRIYEGQDLGGSGWTVDGWVGGMDTKVSEEWRQYLIRRNFDDGIED